VPPENLHYIAGSFGNPEIVKVVAVTLVRRSLSADLMEFVTSYWSNTSATVCAFAKHDVNCLQ
jgi:hypothetical protein